MKGISELQVLQWAEQICYRDSLDITSVMLSQIIAEHKDFYENRLLQGVLIYE